MSSSGNGLHLAADINARNDRPYDLYMGRNYRPYDLYMGRNYRPYDLYMACNYRPYDLFTNYHTAENSFILNFCRSKTGWGREYENTRILNLF